MRSLRNQRGFGSISLYLAGALLVVVAISFFWITAERARAKHWKAEFKRADDKIAVMEAAVESCNSKLKLKEATCAEAIAQCRATVDEVLATATGPCTEITLEGCPEFVIVSDPKKDILLAKLNEMGRGPPL